MYVSAENFCYLQKVFVDSIIEIHQRLIESGGDGSAGRPLCMAPNSCSIKVINITRGKFK